MVNLSMQDEFAYRGDDYRSQQSDYWTVPSWKLIGHTLPRVFLGDHGFLSRYGSTLKMREIVERMHYALSQASLGLAAGDERCLRAARHAASSARQGPCVLYHTDVALGIGPKRVHFGRCMSSLLETIRTGTRGAGENDPIVGGFLRGFADYRPYSHREASDLEIADGAWEKETERMRHFSPAIVTVGGDYLDFALAVGRVDIARSALMQYRQLCQRLAIPLVMTSYTGYFTLSGEQADLLTDLYDAIMIPINSEGLGMLPDRVTLLSWAHQLGKPVIAMHPLASGRVSVKQGLTYVFGEAKAMAAIVGASTHEHIDEFVRSSHTVLGEAL